MTGENCFKVFIMIFSLMMEGNRQAQTKGLSIVVDLEGMTASQATMMSPSLLKKVVVVFLEAFPMDNDILMELTSLYFLNMPKLLEKLFSLFLSFLNKKLRKTISVLDRGSQVLLADMGRDILPAEYGGTNRNTESLRLFWLEEMSRQTEWLEREVQYRTNESLRIGKPKLSPDLSCSVM